MGRICIKLEEIEGENLVVLRSLPTQERGLKYFKRDRCSQPAPSLPTQERGLKSTYIVILLKVHMSLPTQERGLK